MMRTVLAFGLVLGILLASHMVYMVNIVYHNPSYEGNDLLGWAAMIIVFSLTFFGIRNYRNKELGGYISFGRALATGSLIAFLGSTMYVMVWMIYHPFVPDFIDRYSEHVILMAQKSGATPETIEARTNEMREFSDNYKNPLFVIGVSYLEVFPVGLIIALISSLILKRKIPTT